jgi:sec-independent protein translocase protein TatA
MMGLSFPHLALLAIVVLVLFGRGRISEMMGDFGKGIKSFKEGMADDTSILNTKETPAAPPAQITSAPQDAPAQPVATPAEKTPGQP